MKIAVRSGDLERDRELIIDFLARNHTSDSTQGRYAWLYCNAPAGEARVAICYDEERCTPIGVAAAFPRQLCIENSVSRGWVLGDFCIASAYRTLGPALALQRKLLADLQEAGPSPYYDFPSAAMTAIYQRLDIHSSLRLARVVRVLRIDGHVQGLVANSSLATVLSSIGNAGIGLVDLVAKADRDHFITLHEGEIGKEFTELAQHVGSTAGTCLWRSAEYLHWRYREHPYRTYAIYVMRRNGILQGYCVVQQQGQILDLVDIFGVSDSIGKILVSVIALARARECESVAAELPATHGFLRAFKKAGFLVREYFPMIVSSVEKQTEAAAPLPKDWLLMTGDRES